MIDLAELARHRRMARVHSWRMKNDSAYWDAEIQRCMAEKVRLDAIEARTAADRARGIEVGTKVEIGDQPMVTPAGVETNLKGLRGTVVSLSEIPLGGLLAVVEIERTLQEKKPLTADDLRWMKRNGDKQPLGRIGRVQPRTRYQLPVAKLQLI